MRDWPQDRMMDGGGYNMGSELMAGHWLHEADS